MVVVWDMVHRARGFRITKCYPSAVHSMLTPFAGCFGGFLPGAVCRVAPPRPFSGAWVGTCFLRLLHPRRVGVADSGTRALRA